ncbi:MAG TPA: PilZ domain-containing protein [Accumulibacter sp.]|nr:PilZ domain-containing protein [Accumulibacter sp.]HMW17082.1 PilZ domain-containing protein [Accumulibacter sp.]HMY05894.1 PilZ domain-containing protein [Accumulibacter sp.]HNC18199.1 PilZ domain-containing protein [Accumulibacter sp.]HND79883.1 PilZ domain-containing protein [Accumulibacter sp.]
MNPDRRHHTRIAFASPAFLLANAEEIPVRLLDISLKGALVELPPGTALRRGTATLLRIDLGQDDQQIRIEASIAHLEDQLAGIACQTMDIDSATLLRRLVELNLGNPDLVDRELSALISS